jgi:hypothetical protein
LSGLQFRLSWDVSVDNVAVDHYQVEYRADAFVADGTGANIGNPTTNSIDFTVPISSSVNSFRVQAWDAAGNSSGWQLPADVEIFLTPDTIAPEPPPTNLTATVSFGNVNLNWTAAGDNIGVSGYDLFRATTSGGPYTIVPCAAFSMTCTVTGVTSRRNISVTPGTYYYVVQAYDAANNKSAYSNEATVTVLPAAPPSVPGNLSANLFGRQVSLSWTASVDDGAVANYEVQYKPNLAGTWTLVGSPTVTNFDYSVAALVTQPYFRVRAKDNDNLYSAYTELNVNVDGSGCTEAFCNQWDAITSANRTACAGQCAMNSGCCRACVNSTNNYVGCQLNPDAASNSCPSSQVTMPTGVRCD